QAHTYQTTLKNVYGMTVVSFQYRVSYTAGGSYRGAGKYLTNVAVAPQDLYVAWGYTFNATASVPNITNAGTERAPVAGAQILVKWSIDTDMAHSEQSAGYY